ncbi:hypothetical protein ACS0TY_020962 [Phlomoides rotata]
MPLYFLGFSTQCHQNELKISDLITIYAPQHSSPYSHHQAVSDLTTRRRSLKLEHKNQSRGGCRSVLIFEWIVARHFGKKE